MAIWTVEEECVMLPCQPAVLLSYIPVNESDIKYGLLWSCVSACSAEPKMQAGFGPRYRSRI